MVDSEAPAVSVFLPEHSDPISVHHSWYDPHGTVLAKVGNVHPDDLFGQIVALYTPGCRDELP